MSKHLKSLLLLGSVSLLTAGCATVHRVDSTQHDVVPLSQLIEHPDQWQDIAGKINGGKTVFFKVAAGQRIPLKLTIDTPVVGTVEKSETMLAFNREVYLLMSQTQLQVSPDGQRWASVWSTRSLKKLFGFKGGKVSLAFQGSQSEGTCIAVELKAH